LVAASIVCKTLLGVPAKANTPIRGFETELVAPRKYETLMIREFLTKLVAATVLCGNLCGSGSAAQEKYPSRVVQIVNPYQVGGTTDTLARALAVGLSKDLGQQFVVLNKPGAGGTVGTTLAVRSAPDGYTLLFAPALVISVLPQVRPKSEVGYEPQALVPICQTFANTMGLLVRDDSPIKDLKDLSSQARAHPGALNYGHQGLSTIPQLAMEEFLSAAKLQMNGVPYRGDPEVLTDLLGGRIDVAAVVLGAVGIVGHGARFIAVFGEERHRSYPEALTAAEQGFNVAPTSFGGLFAPSGTPAAILDTLAASCAKAVKDGAYVSAAEHTAQPRNYFADRDTFRDKLRHDINEKKKLLDALGQSLKE
jgi:tripartite-type tricarboxylate transporter receptor subunit TctC